MSQMFFKGSREEVTLPLIAKCIGPKGRAHPVHIKGRYRVISRDEQESLRQQLADKVITLETAIRAVLLGWEDVRDKDENPIEYNEENLSEALNNPYYFEAFGDGAGEVIYSQDIMAKVKSKNS